MEIGYDKIREYLGTLMKTGDFSYEDAANLSGIPAQTIRNIVTGKTPDPRFGTVAKIILSLGGDLNDIVGGEKKKEIEVNSMVSLKETYELRIADLTRSYETRIADLKAFADIRVADIQKSCEVRLADMKQFYEDRLAELRDTSK